MNTKDAEMAENKAAENLTDELMQRVLRQFFCEMDLRVDGLRREMLLKCQEFEAARKKTGEKLAVQAAECARLTERCRLLERETEELHKTLRANMSGGVSMQGWIPPAGYDSEKTAELLLKAASELGAEEEFLAATKRQILTLNNQLYQANEKIRIYEEKLNKVYNTWYGKIVLKCYKVLRKVKHLMVRKKV